MQQFNNIHIHAIIYTEHDTAKKQNQTVVLRCAVGWAWKDSNTKSLRNEYVHRFIKMCKI